MDIKRKARFGPEGRSSIPWNQTWSTPSEKAQGVFRPEPVYLIEAEVNKRIQAGFLFEIVETRPAQRTNFPLPIMWSVSPLSFRYVKSQLIS